MEAIMPILSDIDIKAQIAVNKLIYDGDPSHVGPACYELRMGSIYYDLTESDKQIDASASGYALIKPGHRVVLITEEELKIPNNIIARVSSKGSLFSIGLSPVSTYADPGFTGKLGIVTQNLSDKYIKIPIREYIAKIDFSLLTKTSENPYQGQHGFQTQIWPIKHQLQQTYEDVKHDPRVGSEDDEAFKILPHATACFLKQLHHKQRKIDASIFIALFTNTLMLAALSKEFIEPFYAIATNLISSAVVAVAMWFYKPKG
jgi:dCTP deaminase